jgi:dipeptidyl aminopeptidase/acylaminoacyl peptidase
MHKPSRAIWTIRLVAVAVVFACTSGAAKRPLTHADYDSWKSISSITLSRDGHYLAYALFPQEGDGQVVIRDLKTQTEKRESAGAQPPPPAPDPESEAPPRPPTLTIRFSHDSKTVVFTTFAPKAETDAAKKAKKKPEEMPKGGLVIVPLVGTVAGTVVRVEHVENFQLPEDGDGWVAFLKQSGSAPVQPAQPVSPARARARSVAPGELVLRSLADGSEKVFAEVTEYAFTKDAGVLAYAVNSKAVESSGVYEIAPGSESKPLLAGKGRYSKLVWDKPQRTLAFLSSHDDAHLKLYGWRRDKDQPEAFVSEAPSGYELSESGVNPVVFSKDGSRVFYSLARVDARRRAPATDTIPDDKPSFDLWHYKDDNVQPIQKVRAGADRARTFAAAYDFGSKKWTQLADETMAQVIPSAPGTWALGSDDRAYRAEAEYSERYHDTYFVDTAAGTRKLVARKHTGTVTWSADGKHALTFNGKDWSSINLPQGDVVNLTEKLNAKFQNEEFDSPTTAPPYGTGGWTKDGRVLLYDRYDIWSVSPSNESAAVNLTQGTGRKGHLTFHYVKLDPEEESVDTSKPLLLHAENEETYESGFYRLEGGAPHKLVMSAREYGVPVKAKDADVLAMTAGSFSEYPDILVTDASMKEARRATNANPQKEELSWGTSELVSYVNADGVHLHAALYKPENFDPKKKYPMLVYIYERLARQVNHFVDPRPGHSINISYYVSNGYLVLTPDIVYTEGYPGQSALKCVLPAVQAMVDRGFVDPDAIGIQGHSWGGYQIAYMITQTNRFRAASAGAPVANMTSAYDGIRWGSGLPRQFQYEKTQSRIGGSLWQYPMRFIENSPLFQADRIRTPVLMLSNDADDAVPWYQGIEFYLALRRLGKEVYMFSYNGEPHHLNRRPNQKDYTMRLQQYFDHYLKGAPAPDWMVHGISYLDKQAALAAGDAK